MRTLHRRCLLCLVLLGLPLGLSALWAADSDTSDASKDTSSSTSTSTSAVKTQSANDAVPYGADEFPSWARDLRRGEIVAFGALPFTVFFSKFVVDSIRFAEYRDFSYAPWPFNTTSSVELSEDQKIQVFVSGAVVAVAVALVDWVVVRVKRSSHGSTRSQGRYKVLRRGVLPDADSSGTAGALPPDSSTEAP